MTVTVPVPVKKETKWRRRGLKWDTNGKSKKTKENTRWAKEGPWPAARLVPLRRVHVFFFTLLFFFTLASSERASSEIFLGRLVSRYGNNATVTVTLILECATVPVCLYFLVLVGYCYRAIETIFIFSCSTCDTSIHWQRNKFNTNTRCWRCFL